MGITEVGQSATEVQLSANPGELKNSEGETVIAITNDQEVGIGTLTPDRKLEVLDDTNPQLRLTQADGSKFTDLKVDSTGVLNVQGDAVATMAVRSAAANANIYIIADDDSYNKVLDTGPALILGVTNSSKTGRIRMQGSGTILNIGVGGTQNAIVIDASKNATFIANLNTSGNVTLGDTGDDIHTVNGGATLQRNATSYVLTGSIDPAASTTVTGVGTAFLTELVIGDRITVTGETRRVTAIASATSLTVDTAFSDNANDASPDRLPAHLVSKDGSGNVEFIITDESNVGIGVAGPASTLEVRGTTGERTLTTGAAVSPTQIDLSYDASNKATIGAGSSGELVLWADDCMTHIRSDDTCTFLQIQNSTTGYYGSSNNGLSIAQNGNNAFIKNTEPGSLQLHSGTTSGANLALEINSSGEITVLGSDTPVADEVLSWDGSKAVWEPPAGGAITMQVATNVDVTATVDTMVIVDSSAAIVTVTLPAVAGNAGKFVIVKARHADAFTVTVDGDGADIDGDPDQTLTSAMASIEMICDGAEWWIR